MLTELNEQGIFLLDIYLLDYYGTLVFFQVCGTTKNSVFLIELATKGRNGQKKLCTRLNPTPNPLVVLENNVFTKSTFEVFPEKTETGDYVLPIKVEYNSPLFRKAMENTDFPIVGTAYAVKVNDIVNKYWEVLIEGKKTYYA